MKKYIIIIICIFTIILLFACGSEEDNESFDISSKLTDDISKQGESQESSIEESSLEESSEIPEESSDEPINYLRDYKVVRTLLGGKYCIVEKNTVEYKYDYALVTSNNELIIDFSNLYVTQEFDMTIIQYKGNFEPNGIGAIVINSEGEIIIPLNKYRYIRYTGEYFIAGIFDSPDELYTILNKDTSVFETDIKFNSYREYTVFDDFTTFELEYMIEGEETLYYQLWYDADTQSIMLEAFDRMKAVEEHLGIFTDMVQRAVKAAKTDDRETLAELLTEEVYNEYVELRNGIGIGRGSSSETLINEDGTGYIYVVHKDVELYEENLKLTHNYMYYINFRKGGTTTFYFYWEHMYPIDKRVAWFESDGEGNFKISKYIWGLDM